jgi:hypothetical protein
VKKKILVKAAVLHTPASYGLLTAKKIRSKKRHGNESRELRFQ